MTDEWTPYEKRATGILWHLYIITTAPRPRRSYRWGPTPTRLGEELTAALSSSISYERVQWDKNRRVWELLTVTLREVPVHLWPSSISTALGEGGGPRTDE